MSAISKTDELIGKIEDESLFEILGPICIRKTVYRRAAFTAMSLFLAVAASPAFAQENSADTPSSKTSSAGTLEIFGGYVRYKDSCCEGGGFAIGIASVLGLDREGGFRLGFRPEIAYHSANLGAQGIGVLLLAANVQIEAGSLKGPLVGFVYGGGGWMGINGSGFTSGSSTSSGAVCAGGGVRVYLAEDLYIAPQVAYVHAYNQTKADQIRVAGGLGAAF